MLCMFLFVSLQVLEIFMEINMLFFVTVFTFLSLLKRNIRISFFDCVHLAVKLVISFFISLLISYCFSLEKKFDALETQHNLLFIVSYILCVLLVCITNIFCNISLDSSRLQNRKKSSIIFYSISGVINAIVIFLFLGCKWFNKTYGISFSQLIGTLAMPVTGTGKSVVDNVLISLIPILVFSVFLSVSFSVVFYKVISSIKINVVNRQKYFSFNRASFCIYFIFSLYFFICTSRLLYVKLRIKEFFNTETTKLYENYYVNPAEVEILAPSIKKNLILIYLESMETTYDKLLIPNLYSLASENISFSHNSEWGGAYPLNGSRWTIASLFSSTSGVPFSFPIGGDDMDIFTSFASGVTNLGDILKLNGYTQRFLCGSDGSFAGRSLYFKQHGDYEIFDYFTAREKKYIPEDYGVWWGYEDRILFEIAKDQLLELSQNDNPFNFTMLTVDTHHMHGYKCSLCENTYSDNLSNVLICQDNLVNNFVKWIKEQPFYEKTVIVIAGDHPRMDTDLVSDYEYMDRHVYNCFINLTDNKNNAKIKNRDFGVIDLFPTILGALDFSIEGDRLALGTNLFSDKETLYEELGVDYLNNEIGKHSDFYLKNFP